MSGTGGDPQAPATDRSLYFFPEQEVSESELRAILEGSDMDKKAWATSHLLRYAVWDDIWSYVSRDQVRELWPRLDLSPNLRKAWGRMLKVESVSP